MIQETSDKFWSLIGQNNNKEKSVKLLPRSINLGRRVLNDKKNGTSPKIMDRILRPWPLQLKQLGQYAHGRRTSHHTVYIDSCAWTTLNKVPNYVAACSTIFSCIILCMLKTLNALTYYYYFFLKLFNVFLILFRYALKPYNGSINPSNISNF